MSFEQSPLFEPVLWEGNGFKILDERVVPEQLDYIEVNDVSQALEAVRDMKTRAFGQVLTFLYSGALMAQRFQGNDAASLRQSLAEMTEQFCLARPTFDFKTLGYFFEEWFRTLPSKAAAGETIAERARDFAQQIMRARRSRAKRAAMVLPSPARVMTHCNVSGELVAIARHCKEIGKEFTVIATETRPYLQGARLTAWELVQAGVDVTVIPDCAVAQVLARGEVNAIIVGADRSAQNGDIVNKVGTYPIACMAKAYEVPFYALVQDPHSLKRGSDVLIEERPAHELLVFQGEPLVASAYRGLSARYPSFDITPGELVTHLIGFDDLYTPESYQQKYQVRESVVNSKATAGGEYILLYGIPPKSQYPFLISALKAEQAQSVLVPEMRPELWGTQLVARELLDRSAPTTLIADSMMGALFAQGEIRKLCLFYERLTEEGPEGICGSLLTVQLARLHGVPIELFAGEEHRTSMTPDRDVSTLMGKRTCPVGVKIRAAESEVIPWALFRG
jgi:methylthioribose-1-phosphate isomerase